MPTIKVTLDSKHTVTIKTPNKAAARAHAMAIAVEGVRATRTTSEGKWDLVMIPPHRIIKIIVDNGGLEEEYPALEEERDYDKEILEAIKNIKVGP